MAMNERPEQRTEVRRWTLEGGIRKHTVVGDVIDTLVRGPWIALGESVEVMPVTEMETAAREIVDKSIGSEVLRQAEEEASYYREAALELVEAWEHGELSECGSTFRRLKKMLAQETCS